MASNCPDCGAQAPDEARFCMRCGRERDPVPAAEPKDAAPTPAAAAAPRDAAEIQDSVEPQDSVEAAEGTAPTGPAASPSTTSAPGAKHSEAPTHPETLVVPPAPESPAPPAPPTTPPPPATTPAPAAAAPGAPPLTPPPPPPPGHTPDPAGPSPVGAYLGRALRGDWAGAAQAALWPLALLLITAVGCAIPSYGQDGEDAVGFGDRMRLALATALQAVGGDLTLTGREERTYDSSLSSPSSSSSSDAAIDGTLSVHLVPLTVTALFVLALFIGVRILRNRLRVRGATHGTGGPGTTAGLEAALRVGVLTAAGVLALALFAQPEIEGVELSSAPFLATLGALGLALVVSCAVLHGDDLVYWLAERPGAQAFLRAARVALYALAIVLVLASAVGYLALTQIDDLSDAADTEDAGVSPYVAALFILPNLGLAALGVGWGAPLEAEASGRRSAYGGDQESQSFGLSELGDLFNSGAVVGALALGLVCALTIGVLAARRCAGRGEQILSAGLFFGLFLLLAAVGGFGVETSAHEVGFGGDSAKATLEGGVSLPDALLFGLLWVAGAVVVGPFLARMAGQGGGVGGPPAPPGPPGSGWSPVPGGAHGAHVAHGVHGAVGGAVHGVGAGTGSAPDAPAVGAGTGSAPDAPAMGAGTGPAPDAHSVGAGTGPAPDTHAAPTQSALPLHAAPAPAPGPPPPGTPPHATPPHGPAPAPYHPHTFQLGHPQAPHAPQPASRGSRGRAGVWVGTLAGAFVIGGGAAAGILLWQDDGDDKSDAKGKDDRPAVSRTDEPAQGAPSDTPTEGVAEPTPSGSPTDSGTADGGTDSGTDGDGSTEDGATDSVDAAPVPAGSERVTDTMGFSFAVPDGWSRERGDNPTQITYAGSTGPENFQIGVIDNADYTSYGNLKNMEDHAKKDPDKSDYQRVRLEDTTFQGRPAAVWEYTFKDRADRTIHAINHSYIADNGTEYALQLSWREDFWPAGHGAKTHRTALETWHLTG